MTQEQQVIETFRKQGGYATLRRLNEVMDFSNWKTKTPEASVRRIVQDSKAIFRIQPGLWALENVVLKFLRHSISKKAMLQVKKCSIMLIIRAYL